MKNSNIFLILILSIVSMFIISSCDQGSDQPNSILQPNDTVTLVPRGDCEECPEDEECCCGIWLQPSDNYANLVLCGTSNGSIACLGFPPGSCPSFSGGGLGAELTTETPKKGFCALEDMPIYIRNIGIDTAKIIVSCQMDVTPPDTMWLIIPPLSIIYLETTSTCELQPCP